MSGELSIVIQIFLLQQVAKILVSAKLSKSYYSFKKFNLSKFIIFLIPSIQPPPVILFSCSGDNS